MIEGLFAPMHLLVLGGIAMLVFGPSRLPELGRGLGQAIRAFKVGLEEIGAPRPPATPEFAAQAPVDPAPQSDWDHRAPPGATNGSSYASDPGA